MSVERSGADHERPAAPAFEVTRTHPHAEPPEARVQLLPAENEGKLVSMIHRADDSGRIRLATWLQKTAGNRSATGLMVQRHPEGATLTVEEDANAEPHALGGADKGLSSETGTPAPSEAPAKASPAGPAKGAAPAAKPAKLTPQSALSVTAAQKYLEAVYGKTKKIQAGNIVELKDAAATWAEYDKVNKGRTNPYTNKPWEDGDAKKYIPGLQGFQDADKIYVNVATALHTTTVHEMLHLNTAAGFRGAVGETINEGTTEMLALKALEAAGVPATPGVQAYPTQVGMVRKLAAFVTEDTLISAYFGGAATLTDAFEALTSKGAWTTLKGYAEKLDETNFVKSLTKTPAKPAAAPK